MALLSQSAMALSAYSASDFFGSSMKVSAGIHLRTLDKPFIGSVERRKFTVVAKLRRAGKRREWPWPKDPDPNVKGYPFIYLSEFKPLKEKPPPVVLEFEKPLVNLEKHLNDVLKLAKDTGLDFSDQIAALEESYQRARKRIYTNLTPYQRLLLARHPNRPTFLDHVFSITEWFVELHGDRAGYDDPAIVCGLGVIDDKPYMFIGHQKGRNTKENIKRNFGMPTPHGYRKAQRLMHLADSKGIPIVTFIDTPGAFADLKSEELGQGEAIAKSMEVMFGLKVPIISIVIGEGGSGGALAIACGNKLLMLENAVFYVASPEAAAAILYKNAKAAPIAARKLKITATALQKLKICDVIVPEPIGGAHADPEWTAQQLKAAINKEMDELRKMNTEELLNQRRIKFQTIGDDKVMPLSRANAIRDIRKMNKMIEKLDKELAVASDKVFKSVDLKVVQEEISKCQSAGPNDIYHLIHGLEILEEELKQRISELPNFPRLMAKFEMLAECAKAKDRFDRKKKFLELNKKIRRILNRLKRKYEVLEVKIYSSEDPYESQESKLAEVRKKIDFKLVCAIKSMGVPVSENMTLDKLDKFYELHNAINQRIKTLRDLPALRRRMGAMVILARKAKKSPEDINNMVALRGEIQEILKSTFDMKQEYEQLRTEIFGPLEFEVEDCVDDEVEEEYDEDDAEYDEDDAEYDEILKKATPPEK